VCEEGGALQQAVIILLTSDPRAGVTINNEFAHVHCDDGCTSSICNRDSRHRSRSHMLDRGLRVMAALFPSAESLIDRYADARLGSPVVFTKMHLPIFRSCATASMAESCYHATSCGKTGIIYSPISKITAHITVSMGQPIHFLPVSKRTSLLRRPCCS